jgi:hypothetical protein
MITVSSGWFVGLSCGILLRGFSSDWLVPSLKNGGETECILLYSAFCGRRVLCLDGWVRNNSDMRMTCCGFLSSNLPTIPWNDRPRSGGIRAHHLVEPMPVIAWNTQAAGGYLSATP